MADSPYVFPSTNSVKLGDYVTIGHPGMTLRDWFAGQALAHQYTQHDGDSKMAAAWAYAIADAMIAERAK